MTLNGMRRNPLIKCIRANLMLPWISRHLPSRVVLIVRHPGAVIESELRGRWNPSFALDRFRRDTKLHELTKGRYVSLLHKKLEPVEGLALRWVIENQWVMESAAASGISVVHYEHLRSSTDSGWRALCGALSLSELPNEEALTRPSQQSATGRSFIPIAQSKTPRWMTSMAPEHREQIRGVLEAVELERYHMNDPEPRHSGASAVSITH